jgi:hypothetical protein
MGFCGNDFVNFRLILWDMLNFRNHSKGKINWVTRLSSLGQQHMLHYYILKRSLYFYAFWYYGTLILVARFDIQEE